MEEEVVNEFTSLNGIGKSKVQAAEEAEFEGESEVKDAEEIEAETLEIEAEEEPEGESIEVPTAELEIDPPILRLLKVRKRQKSRKPHFVQTDQHKKKRLKDTWRRPRGLHNKKRRYILGKGEMARPGYGSPSAVKGLHPSGFKEILLNRVQDVDNVDPNTQAIRISRTIGQRKRIEIVKKARSLGLKILNPPLEEGGEQ